MNEENKRELVYYLVLIMIGILVMSIVLYAKGVGEGNLDKCAGECDVLCEENNLTQLGSMCTWCECIPDTEFYREEDVVIFRRR